MKIFPRLRKIKLTTINSIYFTDFEEMHGNLGQFYCSGDIKASWKYNDETRFTIFKENDLAFSDNGYFKNKTCCIQKGSQIASYPYKEFKNGWQLKALTEKATFICIQYDPNFYEKLNDENSLSIYDYHVISSPKQIEVEKDDYALILQGKPLVNGQEKSFKSWINFSKKQTITVDSTEEKSVIILFK